ncbi:hypothetical protein Bcoa_2227 [Heyndrickxia coagulans 36D1]|uniref:Uncharacterized protein n=1 Tax=Heyndrickxia coagulans 36D1 TaxID=345219 RepID=G2TP85_HEYCO|nr:hypothetical protein Bcoa_2227 [Heyndrickxia coagulans 36D1]
MEVRLPGEDGKEVVLDLPNATVGTMARQKPLDPSFPQLKKPFLKGSAQSSIRRFPFFRSKSRHPVFLVLACFKGTFNLAGGFFLLQGFTLVIILFPAGQADEHFCIPIFNIDFERD